MDFNGDWFIRFVNDLIVYLNSRVLTEQLCDKDGEVVDFNWADHVPVYKASRKEYCETTC